MVKEKNQDHQKDHDDCISEQPSGLRCLIRIGLLNIVLLFAGSGPHQNVKQCQQNANEHPKGELFNELADDKPSENRDGECFS